MADILPDGIARSGSITTGGTAQTVAPANPGRHGMTFQNTSDTDMYITEDGTTASASNGYKIGAGIGINISTNKVISVFCVTTGKTFAATEF